MPTFTETTATVKRRYGKEAHPLFVTYRNMVRRCTKTDDKDFPDYGGRGITVCERWNSFDNFIADMGDKPVGYSLDRKDNSKGYSPDNCRWASPREQALNTRKNNAHPNVYWSRHREKWYVQFYKDGKRVGKGGIATLEEALKIREEMYANIH